MIRKNVIKHLYTYAKTPKNAKIFFQISDQRWCHSAMAYLILKGDGWIRGGFQVNSTRTSPYLSCIRRVAQHYCMPFTCN